MTFTLHTIKINSKWIIILNGRDKILKGKVSKYLQDIGFGGKLYDTKTTAHKRKKLINYQN